MEFEDVESDLQSLRKLYGLLKSNEPRSETCLLDQNTQMVLKCLLDAATEELFARESEILAAAQFSLSDTGQGKSLQELKKPLSRNVSNSWRRGNNSSKDWDYCVFRPSGDRESSRKLPPFVASAESSQRSETGRHVSRKPSLKHETFGLSSSECNNNAQACRLGESDRYVSRHAFITRPLRAKEKLAAVRQLQRNVSNARSIARCSASVMPRGAKLSCKGNSNLDTYLTEEVSDAIERIDTKISALRLCARRFESDNDEAPTRWMYKTPSSITSTEENSPGKRQSLYEGYNVTPTTQTMSQEEGTEHGKNCYTPVTRQRVQISDSFHASPSVRTSYGTAGEDVLTSRVTSYDGLMMPPQSRRSLSLHNQLLPVESPVMSVKSRPPLPPRPVRPVSFRRPSQSNRML